MSPQSVDELGALLPDNFPISLIMQASPSDNPWIDAYWEALGILSEKRSSEKPLPETELIHDQSGVRRYLHRGFLLRLHVDECESYYHNLLSPNPSCYVVASVADDGSPLPTLVTLSFDEAHAYLEGEENLYTVPLPPEIYRWTEAFVLAHYVPTKRIKRKRQDWRQKQEAQPR